MSATISARDLPSTRAEAADGLRGGRSTSLALTRELLSRARTTQDTVGAFMTFTDGHVGKQGEVQPA